MNTLKAIWKGFVWSLKNLIWKPIVWLAKTVEKISKPKKKPEFKTSSVLSDVQKAASKSLPQLTKLLGEKKAKKKKLMDELSTVNAEIKAAGALIKAAGGDLGQYAVERNKSSSNNSNKGNNSNNSKRKQDSNVSMVDAEFA
jgi:hypothetical protein